MKARICSTGSYLPSHKIENVQFESVLDTTHDWIVQRTGIESRYFEDKSLLHMAVEAARKACESLDLSTIDCILVATYTQDNVVPTVASSVRRALGITRSIAVYDINAACSGFIHALHIADAYIRSNTFHRILVIGCDMNSRILNYRDRSTAVLFGDGAGAVVLEGGNTGIDDCVVGSETDFDDAIVLPNRMDAVSPFVDRKENNHVHFEMKGASVFKFAVRIFEHSIREVLTRNHLVIDDIDYIVSHQANKRIIERGAQSLNCPITKFPSNIDRVGNTTCASIPILLDELNQKRLLKPNMRIILIAFGGGLTYGTVLLHWG